MLDLKEQFAAALAARGLTPERDFAITSEPGADLEWSTRVDFAFPTRKLAFEVRRPDQSSSRQRAVALQQAGWEFHVLTEDVFPLAPATLDSLLGKVG
jgi:hypothetical protein